MADSIPLEVGLPPSFFLEQEGAIDLLLTFSDWDCPSHEDDIRAAVSLMVPAGCSAELIRLGGMAMEPISCPICWTGSKPASLQVFPPRRLLKPSLPSATAFPPTSAMPQWRPVSFS
jgi:hypothetical protein